MEDFPGSHKYDAKNWAVVHFSSIVRGNLFIFKIAKILARKLSDSGANLTKVTRQ